MNNGGFTCFGFITLVRCDTVMSYWNSCKDKSYLNVIRNTCSFSATTSQNICCENDLWATHSTSLSNKIHTKHTAILAHLNKGAVSFRSYGHFYLCSSRWWAWLSKPYLDGHSSRYMQVCLKPWPFFKLSCIHVQPTQCTNMQTHHSLSFLVSHTASPLSSLSFTHTPKETHVGGLTPGCLQCIQEYCY